MRLFVGKSARIYSRQPLWQMCSELYSCFSVGHLEQIVEDQIAEREVTDIRGQFGWIGETCILGDFSIYKKLCAMTKRKRKKIKTNNSNNGCGFGYAYRGVASLMVMHKRFDLLINYPHDRVSFAESPLTMLSFGIVPIKTIYCYQHFKKMGIPNVAVALSDLKIVDCLKTLWVLIWSTKFAKVLCNPTFDLIAAKNYLETRKYLIEMFNNQSKFEECWFVIGEEKQDDESIKTKRWKQFKMIVQGLFTIPYYYMKKEKNKDGSRSRQLNELFEIDYVMLDSYLDEFGRTVEEFNDYYKRLFLIFRENESNAFDKPIIDDIIMESFKPYKHLLNMKEIQSFKFPNITDSKSFIDQLFHMF